MNPFTEQLTKEEVNQAQQVRATEEADFHRRFALAHPNAAQEQAENPDIKRLDAMPWHVHAVDCVVYFRNGLRWGLLSRIRVMGREEARRQILKGTARLCPPPVPTPKIVVPVHNYERVPVAKEVIALDYSFRKNPQEFFQCFLELEKRVRELEARVEQVTASAR